ncbi:MAG TPA: thioether cross-link-forming SCIFF peptide maturase [Oscillospiraceae bacterium]|nr:thioether cross-link-forming SCIFF peptide maturase [Oscillospiraceae bacterium]
MIHKYQQNGYNIVLDVESGGVHVVDKLTYELLDHIEPPLSPKCPEKAKSALLGRYTAEEIDSSYEELYELYEQGILFSPDDYRQFAVNMAPSPVKAMCLHIAHDCNLRCEYCFASTGDFGKGRKLMDFDTGKRAIDFLLENSGDRTNLELDFFGGEPLMNFGVVRQIVEYARSREQEYGKRFRFTITTNGVLIDKDKIDFINREMSNVVLSIDGRKEVNDRMRKHRNGSGSYDTIVERYVELCKARDFQDYYVRGTFTGYNLDFTKDVMHLYDLGFDQISVEPAVTEATLPYAITEKDLPTVFAEYEKLALELLKLERKRAETGEGKYLNFFHFMLDLEQGPCAIKRLRGCGCGNEYVAITPDGDIYPCHQFVGIEDWKMGNLFDKSFDLQRKEYFAKANIYTKQDCSTCWAKFYCSGGCNANNLIYAGDVLKPHKLACEMQKKRLECAIMMKAAQADME